MELEESQSTERNLKVFDLDRVERDHPRIVSFPIHAFPNVFSLSIYLPFSPLSPIPYTILSRLFLFPSYR